MRKRPQIPFLGIAVVIVVYVLIAWHACKVYSQPDTFAPTPPPGGSIPVQNQLLFTTNAFPLSPGTSWNLSKPYQRIVTNADFVIGSLGGLTNNTYNWGVLLWSNSDSATHFCDATALSVTPIGPNSTNKVYQVGGGSAVLSIGSWGINVYTGLVTQVSH